MGGAAGSLLQGKGNRNFNNVAKSLLLHTLEKNQSVIPLLAWLVEKGEEEEEGVDAAAARALRQDGSILERWERGSIAMTS